MPRIRQYPQTTAGVRQLVADNPNIFKDNKRFTEARLCAWFGIEQPVLTGSATRIKRSVRNFNLQKSLAYSTINRVMKPEGLCISQEDMYYRVKDRDATDRKVAKLQARATADAVAAVTLARGNAVARTTGVWSPNQ